MTDYEHLELRAYGGYIPKQQAGDIDVRNVSLTQFGPLFSIGVDGKPVEVYGFDIAFRDENEPRAFVQMRGLRPEANGVGSYVDVGQPRQVPFEGLLKQLVDDLKSRRKKHSSDCNPNVSPELARYLHQIFE